MRSVALAALAAMAAAIVALMGGCASSGGAAAPMGAVAGNVVGGTAWLGVHGAKLAWKGGKLAAQTTGRTVVGAARGVHEEFSKPQTPAQPTTATPARTAQASQPSQPQSATFAD